MTRKWEINYDPQEGDPVVYLGVHALRWPYHSGVEPTVAFCDAEDDSDEEIERLRSDNAKLREALEYVRDLARTGCAPEAFNATPFEWLKYKNDAVARRANKALEEKAL